MNVAKLVCFSEYFIETRKVSGIHFLTDYKKLSEEKQKIVHEYLEGKRDIIPSDYQVLG